MQKNLVSLQDQKVIVTGAGQGIGRALATAIADLGGRVVAVDLNAEALAALRESLGSERCVTVVGNVADPALASQAIDAGVEAFGGVNALVNNAGVTRTAMIEKMSAADWQQVIDVHLTGAFFFLQALGRHLLASARSGGDAAGSIVNISSDAGRRGTIGQINYGAAKAGVLGLTMCAAREWARYGIRVNTVGFGVVETPMTETIRGEKFRDNYLAQIPLGRWGEADEVVRPVCFLLSDAASYVTGQHLSVNGGYTIGL
ncbi:SDR family NAD(P)-dependent oxidoreductase [Achromobacter arsenitoxydans]|uniref:3-oxoacyl-ACP reductase n=1 Tax=Achromobacter arsenitoxydans SY8 TaxID=477184 RepID=H0FFN6_9BURK|nr:SDR family NAD(P)-dependent oxidoreductase [Achromobacter arsenitoxydans]EHK62916.1 3-oxoacyl-ACP reductase [Achromobacter arsenitoxydans SY8]